MLYPSELQPRSSIVILLVLGVLSVFVTGTPLASEPPDRISAPGRSWLCADCERSSASIPGARCWPCSGRSAIHSVVRSAPPFALSLADSCSPDSRPAAAPSSPANSCPTCHHRCVLPRCGLARTPPDAQSRHAGSRSILDPAAASTKGRTFRRNCSMCWSPARTRNACRIRSFPGHNRATHFWLDRFPRPRPRSQSGTERCFDLGRD